MHNICVYPSGPIATNAYLLENEVAIDPAPGSAGYLKEAKRIWLTHSHWDHIADCAELGLPVSVHPDDAENLRNPGADGLRTFPIKGVEPAHLFEDGEKIHVGSLELEVLHTPGHSPGSVCFYCEGEGFLIGGDLVFAGGIGRLDLPTGQPERMQASLDRIAALPKETIIYPGHGPATTVGEEF